MSQEVEKGGAAPRKSKVQSGALAAAAVDAAVRLRLVHSNVASVVQPQDQVSSSRLWCPLTKSIQFVNIGALSGHCQPLYNLFASLLQSCLVPDVWWRSVWEKAMVVTSLEGHRVVHPFSPSFPLLFLPFSSVSPIGELLGRS